MYPDSLSVIIFVNYHRYVEIKVTYCCCSLCCALNVHSYIIKFEMNNQWIAALTNCSNMPFSLSFYIYFLCACRYCGRGNQMPNIIINIDHNNFNNMLWMLPANTVKIHVACFRGVLPREPVLKMHFMCIAIETFVLHSRWKIILQNRLRKVRTHICIWNWILTVRLVCQWRLNWSGYACKCWSDMLVIKCADDNSIDVTYINWFNIFNHTLLRANLNFFVFECK